MNNKIFKVILSICILIGILLICYGIYNIADNNMSIQEIIETSSFMPFFVGVMFVIVPVIFLLFGDEKEEKNKKKRMLKAYCFNVLAGFVLVVIGIAAYFGMCENNDVYTVKEFFNSEGISGIFPLTFLGLGALLIIYPLIIPRHKNIVLTVSDIYELDNSKFSVVFDDERYKKESISSKINKYYVYDTYNKENFKIDSKYKVDVYKHGNVLETVAISGVDSAQVLEDFNDEEFIKI